jgi:hypothetical protein
MGRRFCCRRSWVSCLRRSRMLKGRASDVGSRLAEADRLAWLTNWYDALPICTERSREGIQDGDAARLVVAHVAGNDGEPVHQCCRGNLLVQRIFRMWHPQPAP